MVRKDIYIHTQEKSKIKYRSLNNERPVISHKQVRTKIQVYLTYFLLIVNTPEVSFAEFYLTLCPCHTFLST